MKSHKRLMASLAGIAANRPHYEAEAMRAWLGRQPGSVRRAPADEQQRQFQAALKRASGPGELKRMFTGQGGKS